MLLELGGLFLVYHIFNRGIERSDLFIALNKLRVIFFNRLCWLEMRRFCRDVSQVFDKMLDGVLVLFGLVICGRILLIEVVPLLRIAAKVIIVFDPDRRVLVSDLTQRAI